MVAPTAAATETASDRSATLTRAYPRLERICGLIGPQLGPATAKRAALGNTKPSISRGFVSSGGGIRTRDLRVMSPTSYLTAPPRVAVASLSRGLGL